MKQEVRKVGKKGEIIEVSDGYGANFLIPNGYAVLYTAAAKAEYAKELAEEAKIKAQKTEEAKAIAERLKTIKLKFEAPAGRNGNMIGTVSFKKVIDALKKDHDITISKGQILDKDVIINGFGDTHLNVDIFNGVIGVVTVHVDLKEKK
jgi:large subunit ribosomal protein L9